MDKQNNDYVWHFKLKCSEQMGDEDALTQMVQEQVAALLRCIAFTSDGADVRVTGFRFLDSPGIDHVLPPALPNRDPEQS